LRKSLKEFDLNLKRKVVLKRSLKKKKGKTLPSHLSAQAAQQPTSFSPVPARVVSFFFLFVSSH
jgi:hypothetical protein